MRVIVAILFLCFSVFNVVALSSTGTFTIEGYCNDGFVAINEECDSTNVSFNTCNSLGYDFGVLSCTGNCTFDESTCYFNSNGGSSGSTNIKECNDKVDNDNDGLIDLKDNGCTNKLDDSEFQEICSPNWQEDSWGKCINNIQERAIIDVNHCGSNYIVFEQKGCFSLFVDEENNLNSVTSGIILLFIALLFFFIIYKKFHKRHRNKAYKFK